MPVMPPRFQDAAFAMGSRSNVIVSGSASGAGFDDESEHADIVTSIRARAVVRPVMSFSFGAEAPEAQMAEENGLAQSVRRRLDEGVSPEVVIDELVAKGLSRGTAQRFVDRALAEGLPPLQTPVADWIPTERIPSMRQSDETVSLNDLMRNPDAVAESQAFNDLWRGMIVTSVG